MKCTEYCTESEKQNGCTSCFTLVIVWLTGSYGLLLLPSIMSMEWHMASTGKCQNSKYCFY